MTLDPRLNAYRDDLADARLRAKVATQRFVEGQPGWVIAARTAVRAKSPQRAETVTFCHYGEELRIFDLTDDYAWCQSLFDSYVGYVEARDIELGRAPTATHYVATMGCYAYEAPDLRSPVTACLPRHSGVTVVQAGLVTRGTEYARVDIAGHVPLACISEKPPRSPDIVSAAALYLGCPYLWGGRSSLGIDCSGLVQSAFRDLGVTVLRDTDMQRDSIGEAVPVGREAELRRGDLLYMPGHVLIYAGDGTVIHANGASMTVRRDKLREWVSARGLKLRDFTVRRHPLAAGAG
jgi:hypothetical protein